MYCQVTDDMVRLLLQRENPVQDATGSWESGEVRGEMYGAMKRAGRT